jgi:hypothetical protein
MAKAVDVPDEVFAERFGRELRTDEGIIAGGRLRSSAHATGNSLWLIIAHMFPDPYLRFFTGARLRGAVAWLRSRDPPALFVPEPRLWPGTTTGRGSALDWIEDNCDAETRAWVMERERQDIEAAHPREAVAAAAI